MKRKGGFSKHVYIIKNLIIILYINIIWADCFPDEEVVSPVVGRHVLLLLGKVEEGLRGPDNHNYIQWSLISHHLYTRLEKDVHLNH